MFLFYNGKIGYNNLVDTLNTLSRYYINPLYANSARNLGTDPANPEDSYTFFENDYITQELEYKAESGYNVSDSGQMTKEMLVSPNKPIWLSRQENSSYNKRY